MIKHKKKIVFFLSIIVLYTYNNFFTVGMLSGTYTNKNYQESLVMPNFSDKLQLNADGTFESPYYGKGNYKINYNFKGTSITLDSSNDFIVTKVTRGWFGSPKIILFRDLSHYYEKEW